LEGLFLTLMLIMRRSTGLELLPNSETGKRRKAGPGPIGALCASLISPTENREHSAHHASFLRENREHYAPHSLLL